MPNEIVMRIDTSALEDAISELATLAPASPETVAPLLDGTVPTLCTVKVRADGVYAVSPAGPLRKIIRELRKLHATRS